MYEMMNGSLMGGMSIFGLLCFIALLLFIAALCKYLFFKQG
jgi:hypothetical protein